MYTTETGKHYNPGYTPLLFFPGEAFVVNYLQPHTQWDAQEQGD